MAIKATPITPGQFSATYWIRYDGDRYIGLDRVAPLPPEYDDGRCDEITPTLEAEAEKLFNAALAKGYGMPAWPPAPPWRPPAK